MSRLPTLRHLRLCCVLLLLALVPACDRGRNLRLEHVYAYVSNGKSNTVTVIDVARMSPLRTIGVGQNPSGITASPTRDELYVVNTSSDNVSVIDARKNTVIATIGVHGAPYFIDVSRDGRRGYVANSGSANVSILDLESHTLITNVSVGAGPGLARVSPDGQVVGVSNRADNSVSIVDAAAMRQGPKPGERPFHRGDAAQQRYQSRKHWELSKRYSA